MNHIEVIKLYNMCLDLFNTYNLEDIEVNMKHERFEVKNKKGTVLYSCSDTNELYGFLIGYTFLNNK